MFYDYYQKEPRIFDEFISKEVYSSNPSLSSLQEIILIYLKEMAYYLLKLKELGATNEIIKENIIEAISGLITNVDYNQEQFQKLILTLMQQLSQAKTLYANFCYKNNMEAKFLKTFFKPSTNYSITDIIKKGEKYYIMRNIEYSSVEKNLFDIMLLLIKNICLNIIKLKGFKKDYETPYYTILTLLNAMNMKNTPTEAIKSLIEKGTDEYNNLIKLVSDAQEERYGKRESVYIPFAPRTGKAILVSGIDLTQLEAVLEATKGQNVDVYTHGMTMLMAHTLPKFRKYQNLVGHFGKNDDHSLFDFAAFPGAILTTRYVFQKTEYLYRGRLFTTDSFAPKGIVKIKNNDFAPLIQAAMDSKGFTKEQQEVILRVGFRQKLMEEKVNEVIGKMEKGEIKHLYFIGILNHENEYKEYFNKFLSLMPKNCFAVTIAHERSEENILHIDSFHDYLLIYKILEKIDEKKSLHDLNITIFITKCDQYTIANVVNFINMGIKNIFLCKCVPTLVNPALSETLRNTFGIKSFSRPEEDLKFTLTT